MADIRDLWAGLAVGLAVLLTGTGVPAWAGTTERVSVGPHGGQGNGNSELPTISADGRFVAFQSVASNLVPHDADGRYDVFVRDLRTGRTELVASGDTPVISAHGRFVAFRSADHNPVFRSDIFVRDVRTDATEQVNLARDDGQPDADSAAPAISADGRFVAFRSSATNLVPGDTNGLPDVFVRDRKLGTTERVSVGPHGVQAEGCCFGSDEPAVSADGRFVAFVSDATNLVPGDTNGLQDIFVRDRKLGTTERASVGPHGVQGEGCCYGESPAISAHGRFVAFASDLDNLVPDDTNGARDIFVRDRKLGTTERVSVSLHGAQADNESAIPAISADGRFVAFQSFADNLVPGRMNGSRTDIFVRDRKLGITERASVGPHGRKPDGSSFTGTISADGKVVTFWSDATNLVFGDTNSFRDVFVRLR